MSLLLDALKRAEQEKLARLDQETPTEEDSPLAKVAQRGNLELEKAEIAPAEAAAPAAKRAREREGAKAVFAAKKTETAVERPGKNRVVIGIGLGALVLLSAGGAYVWYEINRTPGPIARLSMQVAAPKPVILAPAGAPGAGASLPDATSPAAKNRPENLSAATAGAMAETAAPAPIPIPKPPPTAAEQIVTSVLKESATAKPAPALALTRRFEAPRIPADVSRGYDALKNGDAVAARGHYEAAVAADPSSVDARLGLASAAARTGDRQSAARQYRHALELDPRNPAAAAGLAALAGFTRPDALEQQLRADITRNARSPALHFTLGNLFASQGRWNEAQAAYFEAYRLDPESADQAYNLAVSLDHLGQANLAADFYQRALAAAREQAALFDKDQVTRRIAELKR